MNAPAGAAVAFEPQWGPIEEPFLVGDAEWAFDAAHATYDDFAQMVADIYAGSDGLLRDDLLQAARIALWDLDASRLRDDDAPYVRAVILLSMRSAYWSEYRDAGGILRTRRELRRVISTLERNPLPTTCRGGPGTRPPKAVKKKRRRLSRLEAFARSIDPQ